MVNSPRMKHFGIRSTLFETRQLFVSSQLHIDIFEALFRNAFLEQSVLFYHDYPCLKDSPRF